MFELIITQLELVLVKTESITWPSLLASSRTEQLAGPSVVPQPIASDGIAITKPDKRGAGRKNWDQVVDTELGDGKDGEGKDPVSLERRMSWIRNYIGL